jgi:hypothetical protein
MECDISTTPDVSFDTLVQVVNSTITAELLNGKTYVLKEAAFIRPPEINTREGLSRIRFEGTSCEEMST